MQQSLLDSVDYLKKRLVGAEPGDVLSVRTIFYLYGRKSPDQALVADVLRHNLTPGGRAVVDAVFTAKSTGSEVYYFNQTPALAWIDMYPQDRDQVAEFAFLATGGHPAVWSRPE